MQTRSLEALFNPRSVAVVGASEELTRPAGRCLIFLKQFGFGGQIFPINPKYKELLGLPCYPDLASLPAKVDLVILLVPARAIPDYLHASAAAGATAVIVCSSGFAESGAAGAVLQTALVDAAAQHSLAVLGPNSLGMVNLHRNLVATFSTGMQSLEAPQAGPVAFLSQSGAVGAVVFSLAQSDGIGFGKFLSTGNEAVLEFGDYLEYLASDSDTSLVLGYIEGIRRGRRFVEAARRAKAAGKTVAILKVGRSNAGMKAANSHTGALVGSSHVYDAAFRRAGILSIENLNTLLDLAIAIPGSIPPRGPRVGIVSMSGGAGVMMADKCQSNGLVVTPLTKNTVDGLAKILPDFVGVENPVDFGPLYGDPDVIKGCVRITADDPNVDLLVFLGLSPGMLGVIEQRLADVARGSGKPMIVAWVGGPKQGIQRLRQLGVAVYDDVSRAVEVAAQLVRSTSPLPAIGAPDADEAGALTAQTRQTLRDHIRRGQTHLTEREVKRLLGAYGLPVTRDILVTNEAQAIAAARELGGRVAIKIEAPDLVHKSDSGGVRLNIGPDEAAEAYRSVIAAARTTLAPDQIHGANVQPMIPTGLEVLVGLKFDAQFGPTITVGLGGIMSEVLADVVTELAPLDHAIAESMIRRLRSARLFDAFRGTAARDVGALSDVLVNLGRFAMDAGGLVQELDLNPIIVGVQGRGCMIVDGAAILAAEAAHSPTQS